MTKYIFNIIFICCAILVSSVRFSYSTTYFEWTGEVANQYLGNKNAHPGGGYFYWLGGSTAMPEGNTGCEDPVARRNTIFANDATAQGVTAFSKYALKTPYSGACPFEAFQRDTTIINTPSLYEGYARFYQKWTGSWNSSTIQHKFTKFYTSGGLPIVHFSFAPKAKNWRAYVPNIEGHFDKDGVTRYAGQIWVSASSAGAGKAYSGQNVSYDDFLNGIGGTDGEFVFETNKWYSLEFHWKVNSDANTSDGVLEAWVDGKKIFGIYGFKYYNTGTRPFVNMFELQHLYYNRDSTDQPSYMSNIVISDHYNGPLSLVAHGPEIRSILKIQ